MFFRTDIKRGKGVAALSRERKDVSRGGGRRFWMEEDGSGKNHWKVCRALLL